LDLLGLKEVVELLIINGAEMNVEDRRIENLLDYAQRGKIRR
jgi:hypothetical protein